MDILGNVSHNRIGTASETVCQGSIYHHTKILSLINDDMGRFPDWIDFLNSLVNDGKLRNVSIVVNGEDMNKRKRGYGYGNKYSTGYTSYEYYESDIDGENKKGKKRKK